MNVTHQLSAAQLKTPLGIMLAIADEEHLLFLDFVNREMITRWNQKMIGSENNLGPWEVEEERWDWNSPAALLREEPFSFPKFERKLKKILRERSYKLQPASNAPLQSIERELEQYFSTCLDGSPLDTFKTPYRLLGSDFQQAVWKQLLEIPYGATISYAEEAASLGKPSAVRAVANANGANLLALVIPCHRVIATDGKLGGYGSGWRRKAWLLDHEKNRFPCGKQF